MFKGNILRQASRASSTAIRPPTGAPAFAAATRISRRTFHRSTAVLDKQDDSKIEDNHDHYSTAGKPGYHEDEGKFSRTDNRISIEHPDEHNYPRSKPVQGRGGFHFKRTLASFSLEDRVGVVTGGARGLGLVMSQALVISGCDVAIVDLNSKLYESDVSWSSRYDADNTYRGGSD